MNQKHTVSLIGGLVALFILGSNSLFTVKQTEQAFVLQFGQLQRVHTSPGLKIKVPFLQEVIYYDKRLLGLTLPIIEVNAGDQKRMVIDLYARYVIADPVKFFKRIRTEQEAETRLNSIISSSMRAVVADIPLSNLLSKERQYVMQKIHEIAQKKLEDFGINVKDVRIIRADLPTENSSTIFQRMVSEREREAKLLRSEGKKRAQEIRSKADRQKTELLAKATRDAQIARGEGDAKAAQIYADAYSQDPAFFEFYRTQEAYLNSFNPKNTRFVLSKNDKFFKFF